MIIDKNIGKYMVLAEDSILDALKKVSANKSGVVFCVDGHGDLEGILTDGDFRRWIVEQREIDLEQPVAKISNKSYRFASITDTPEAIQELFSERIRFVPLLDDRGRLVAIASKRAGPIEIDGFTIGPDSPVFIIAEIGINHNGSLSRAKELVDRAVAAGADCAKFQMRNMRALYRNEGDADDVREDLGSQYTLDLLSRFSLSEAEMFEVFDYCRADGILPLCTPWDLPSVEALERYGIDAYKVASADLTNHELLTAVADTGEPILLSTGMSAEAEILESVSLLRRRGAPYVLLHCNSTYPAPFKDVNLSYLDRLREIGDCPVGYSGHERGFSIAVAAVARGAKVVEKHFTLDRGMEGTDHKVSLLPDEFALMVAAIRQVEDAIGTGDARQPTQGEMMNRSTLAKSLVSTCDIEPGVVITADMVAVKSPGRGLQPNRRLQLLGRTAERPMRAGDFFFPSDLEDSAVSPRPYSFRRPWGLPVRYHDVQALARLSNMDFLEFHLSYKDMEQEPTRFFGEPLDLAFTVHSPDTFAGDHLLNLASDDEAYRRRSVRELQRVIDLTRSLRRFFRRATRPLLIVSPGGFTKDAPFARTELPRLYEKVVKSFSELDADGVELLPQTLPPFPWYLGGQLYCNLFVNAEDTAGFCEDYGYRICLDVSHTKLAANNARASLKEYLDVLAPHAGHLHLVDAQGADGEGLQIGEGEIDFAVVAEQLGRHAPDAGFIPEIWQGHKNNGEGFWIALERLEQWF